MNQNKIAWFLNDDFDEHTHLFSGVVKTGYKMTTHICSCGDVSSRIDKEFQESHECPKCANTTFYDARAVLCQGLNVQFELIKSLSIKKEIYFKNDTEFLLHKMNPPSEFSFSTLKINHDNLSLKNEVYLQDDATIVAHYYIDVPSSFAFSTSKVNYSKKSIYKLTTHKNSKIDLSYELPLDFFDKNIELTFYKQIIEYAKANNAFDIASIKDFENLLFFEWLYFLQNPFLKDRILSKHKDAIEMMYGASGFATECLTLEKLLSDLFSFREQKSIKKAIYQNWENQLHYNDEYTPLFVVTFCKTIEDVNILKRLIELDLELRYHRPCWDSVFEDFILYLKRFYSQIQIYNLMSEFKHTPDDSIFTDALFAFDTISNDDEAMGDFRKVACKARAVHDEFVRIYRLEINGYKDVVFDYTKEELQKCIHVGGYVATLPQDGAGLDYYGYKLRNCLITYADKIAKKESLIYCFTKDEAVQFALEIVDGKVYQASGIANSSLNHSEQQVLDRWYKICYEEKKLE